MTLKHADDMATSIEKMAENVEHAKPCSGTVDEDDQFSYKAQRKIIHRIDRRLVVMMGAIYCVSLIDRTNLSNAAIAGMTPDLDLNVGFRYVRARRQ